MKRVAVEHLWPGDMIVLYEEQGPVRVVDVCPALGARYSSAIITVDSDGTEHQTFLGDDEEVWMVES